MRIAIVANDSRGGIQPYVALGKGLAAAGHGVRLVAPSDAEQLLDGTGLQFAPLSGSVEEVMRASGGAAEGGTRASMRFVRQELEARLRTWTREALEACTDVDLMTGGVGGMVVGLGVADKLRLPFAPSHLQPIGVATGRYPGVLLPHAPRLGGPGWWLSHRLSALMLSLPFRSAVKSVRHDVLGLTGRSRAIDGQPVLFGFSRHVVPVPRAPGRHVTGYWTLPAESDWQPPPGLGAFLAGDGPMISIGFGSMASGDTRAATATILGTIRDVGVRAVLLTGWGGLDGQTDQDDVFVTPAVPHDWLFPRMAANVHHGGAGTTGAGLAAGVPSVVVPFGVDQPFWGSRVQALGVGPAPIPRQALTRERLAGAIRRALDDEGMRTRAARLGARLRSEDGVAEAVRVISALATR